MSNKRLIYHAQGLTYVRIQAVGVTNCHIKKKMVEYTNNQKRRGNAENKTAFYYIGYRQANVLRTLALISCLEIVTASKSPVYIFLMTDNNNNNDNDNDRRTKPIA